MNAYARGKRGSGAQVRLGMTDRDVVERFGAILQCGNIHKPRDDRWPRKNQGHKPIHTWVVYEASDVVRVIETLLPFFGKRRRTKALEVLAVAREINLYKGKRTHCPKGHPYLGDNLVTERIKRGDTEYVARRCKACRAEQARDRKRRVLGITPDRFRT